MKKPADHPTARAMRERLTELEEEVLYLRSTANELKAEIAQEDKDRRNMPDIYEIHRRVGMLARAMDRYQHDLNYRRSSLTLDALQNKIVKWILFLQDIEEELSE